jgi:hypothetical protein
VAAWEDRVMKSSEVWALVLGAVITLAGSLVVQWANVAY